MKLVQVTNEGETIRIDWFIPKEQRTTELNLMVCKAVLKLASRKEEKSMEVKEMAREIIENLEMVVKMCDTLTDELNEERHYMSALSDKIRQRLTEIIDLTDSYTKPGVQIDVVIE